MIKGFSKGFSKGFYYALLIFTANIHVLFLSKIKKVLGLLMTITNQYG